MDITKPSDAPEPTPEPAPEAPSSRSGPGTKAQFQEGAKAFFARVRSAGVVRTDEAWAGGVCGALAARFSVDPLWVRVAFVAMALLGLPALGLYAILWLVLPNETGRVEGEALLTKDVSAPAIAALALLALELVTTPSFFWS